MRSIIVELLLYRRQQQQQQHLLHMFVLSRQLAFNLLIRGNLLSITFQTIHTVYLNV